MPLQRSRLEQLTCKQRAVGRPKLYDTASCYSTSVTQRL